MTHRQKLLVIALFAIVYGLAAWIAYPAWLGYRDDQTRINFHACPLCEK